MGLKPLVVVESPTKARTIGRFLGGAFRIEASNGHVRDLPKQSKDLTEKHKKEGWTSLGVKIEKDFEPLYIVPPEKEHQVKKLKDALKSASELYLATDEDREGESISWHLLQVLAPKVPVKRLVFHEITKDAIQHAIETARTLDEDLVRAQETRRIVDRLYGYLVSDILRRKMAQGLSAGRVQSIVVRILVEREKERMAFKQACFYGITGKFAKKSGETFEAELTHVDERRVAVGRDFDPSTGSISERSGALWLKNENALSLAAANALKDAVVTATDEKPYENRPSAPFVTSSLQQEANRKLRLSASRTMSIAQQLYENGFITYMRTDSTTLSEQAISAARSLILAEYGPQYLPDRPRLYKTSVKNAQEAHEAIRPAGDSFASIDKVRSQLGPEAGRLYELIWKRTIACQMNNARGTRISVTVQCGNMTLRAAGKTIEFPGFIRAYVEGSDNPESDIADQEKILPKVTKGEALSVQTLSPVERNTQPPAHYTEGSLIKELESRGIGRPSTWATVVETVVNRSYAFRRGNQLFPTFTAFGVYGLLNSHFENLIDYAFTARLEDDLDAISRGEKISLDYLKSFYFGDGHLGLEALLAKGRTDIDPRLVCGIAVGKDESGTTYEVRIGRNGPYLTDGVRSSSLPEDVSPEELDIPRCSELLATAEKSREPLGTDPKTGQQIFLKSGRFGPYVQVGNGQAESEQNASTEPVVETDAKKTKKKTTKTVEKAKTASLLSNMDPQDVTLDIALQLLALPRELGKHPENSEMIIATVGKYGPYIKCGTQTRRLSLDEFSPLTISFDEAMALLNKEVSARGTRQAKTPAAEAKIIGTDPETGKDIQLKSGRFGPYLTDGEYNVSYRPSSEGDGLPSLAEAAELLATKRLAGPPTKKSSRKTKAKTSESKSPGKKVAAKKTPKKTAPQTSTAAKTKAATKKKTANAE